MKREIREVSKDGKQIQVTVADTERWYLEDDGKQVIAYPSVTWVASHQPQSPYLTKWIAEQGYDEAEEIKKAAGRRGYKVHLMCEMLMNGKTIRMEDLIKNPDNGEDEEITLEEYKAVMSFADWFKVVKPEVLQVEKAVFKRALCDCGKKVHELDCAIYLRYAGSIDMECRINGELYIVDLKTSKSIHPQHIYQLSAYKHADEMIGDHKLAVLQLGYTRNKNGYKFTDVEDRFDMFKTCYKFWQEANNGKEPAAIDYPSELSLGVTAQQPKEN